MYKFQKRKYQRVIPDESFAVKAFFQEKQFWAKVINVGMGGLEIKAPETISLKRGDVLELSLEIQSEILEFQAAVIKADEGLHLRFIKIPKNCNILNEYIFNKIQQANENFPFLTKTPVLKKFPSILIVEDVDATRLVLKMLLERLDYHHITEVRNGQEAWELLEKQEFDLVITDWVMPIMDGLSLLKKIRNQHSSSTTIPVIFTSSISDELAVLELWELGINGYLMKPLLTQSIEEQLRWIFEENF